jgi:hypothetical protein
MRVCGGAAERERREKMYLVSAPRDLGHKTDGVGGVWVDADGLVIDETAVLAAVLVGEV